MGASQSEIDNFVDPGPPVTDERITRAIKNWEGTDDVELEAVVDQEGNAKGDGFMSLLSFIKVKARVRGEARIYDWVVKTTPREANRATMSNKIRMDEREVFFFSGLVPQLERFLTDKGLQNLLPSTCDIPYCSWTDQDKVLVMANLKSQGWRDAINKKKGLDVHHLRLAFKWLATFHAVTANYLEEFPGGEEAAKKKMDILFIKLLEVPLIKQVLEELKAPTNANLRSILSKIDEDYPGSDRAEKFNTYIGQDGDLNMNAYQMRDEFEYNFKTICHGDPWFNNQMFRYGDASPPAEIMYVDFQMASHACPALDLTYLLAASTTSEVRRDHLDHLLTLYHTTLTLTLERLGSRLTYEYEAFREDYKNSLLYGFCFAVSALPSVLAEKEEDVVDMENMLSSMVVGKEGEKSGQFEELMEQEKDKFCGSPALLERLRGLWDEMVQAGAV